MTKGIKGPGKDKGGRPVGAATALTRRKANLISQSEDSPLDVMMENMMFWRKTAQNIGLQVEAMLEEASLLPPDERPQALEKLKPLLQNFLDARTRSQECAVDAAPYVHPRLAAIHFKGEPDKNKVITAQLPPVEGDKEDRSYRDNYPTNVTPIKRTA